ncbi:glycoside hydrolase family 113 [Streptomyces sp.]|uniref:glycoside hydrolase family 113 n=1 Tax=Streptomyces sp. TaxID=1931 RepID=UPI002F40DE2F
MSSPPAPAKVADPWQPGDPQLGAQVLWYAGNETDATVRAKALRVVDYMVGKDMNSLAISFPFGTRAPQANEVAATAATPSVRHLAILMDVAAAAGLRITLRPLLDERTLMAEDPLAWRGSLAPTDRDAWFRSYESFLAPYLSLAARHHARTFVIGAELTSLEDDSRWRGIVSAAGKLFPGEISYDANWDDYVSRRISLPVNHLGVDAYFPLKTLGDDASVSAIVAGWQKWLDRKSTGKLPRILLSEVGIPAEDGAYHHPGVWRDAGKPLNLAVQKTWFAAACQVARDRDMAGLYWWNIDFHADPAAADPRTDVHSSFLGRPAESAITSCFRAWAASASGDR